jgi:hypothetical protein
MSATMTATSQKTSKSPCGCGCSGGKTTTPGSCGCSECATCQGQGYTRPLFFAGQLLTEDDLQQLTDYVVAKNRLHTRYLAGSGVVCGLEVVCEPCGGGKVIVNPGYALDCCGNDIVLSCPQTLDINKMVRDLKLKLRGGYDCGDPCAGSETGSTPQSSGTTASTNQASSRGVANSLPTLTPPPPTDPVRKYCLYIDYCEQPSDPVSPYATDAPCGPTTCQPSRIHEGFRFELRCPPECEPEPPLCCRICNCIGDRTAFEQTVADSEHLQVYGGRIMEAWEKLRDHPTLPIHNIPHYLNRLAEQTLTLNKALNAVTNSHLKEKTAGSALRSFIDAVFSLASDIALLRVQSPDIQTQVARAKETNHVVDEAELTLGAAHKKYASLSHDVISQALPTALEQAYASALFRLVHKLVPDADTSAAKPSKSSAEFRGETARPYQLTQTYVRFLAAGALITPHFQSAATHALTALRDWLLYHLETSPQTCCDLFQEVLAITLPPQTSQDELHTSDIKLIAGASLTLCEAVRKVLSSCVCSALIPPCPSCDDPGVLLACLTVQDCQVKNICNMERDFVLTPLAIRYWIPEIQRFGEKVEEWCCQCGCPKEGETQKPERVDSAFPVMESASPFGRIATWLLRAACPDLWKSRDAGMADRFSKVLLNMQSASQESAKEVPSATVAPETAAIREAVQVATATLEKDLGNALNDLESIRNDHKKLLDRVAHLEKARKQPKGQPEE